MRNRVENQFLKNTSFIIYPYKYYQYSVVINGKFTTIFINIDKDKLLFFQPIHIGKHQKVKALLLTASVYAFANFFELFDKTSGKLNYRGFI